MKIQKWLLPNKANKYHPYLLRPLGLTLVFVAVLALNLAQNVTTAGKFQVLGASTSITASDIISLTNSQRTSNGLPALNTNAKLMAAAQAKAQNMMADDYWAHDNPDGTTWESFIINAGYAYSTAGENLAKGFTTSNGVVQGWMGSPEHRANILNSSYVDTGVAVLEGTLQGSDTVLVVAEYASPQAVAAAPAPTTSAPPTRTVAPTTPTKATVPTTTVTPPVTSQPATPEPTPATTQPATTATSKATKLAAATASTIPTKTIDGSQSVSVHESRTWAQNASLFLLSTVLLVNVLKHTVVWRTKKRGWRHIWLRAHPAAQYGLLLVAITANLVSGVGVVR